MTAEECREFAAEIGLEIDDLDETETTLLATFFEAASDDDGTVDVGVAVNRFAAHMEALEAHAGMPAEDDEDNFDGEAWLRANSDVASEFEDFRPFLQASGGDIDKAAALWRQGKAVIENERAKMGGSSSIKTYDDAFLAWEVESAAAKDITSGGGAVERAEQEGADLAARKARALKVKPEHRTAAQRAILNAREPDLLGAALDDFGDMLSADREVREAAQRHIKAERMAIRNQETKGREG